MSHFGPPDSIQRRVGRPLFEGGPDPQGGLLRGLLTGGREGHHHRVPFYQGSLALGGREGHCERVAKPVLLGRPIA